MLSQNNIKDAIYDWLLTVATPPQPPIPVPPPDPLPDPIPPIATVIRSDQEGTRPAGLYVTYKIMSVAKIHEDWKSSPDGDGIATIVGNREITVSLRAYRSGAFDYMQSVRTSIEKDSIRSLLLAGGLIHVRHVTPVNNLTSLYDTKFGEVYGSDELFRTSSTVTDDVGVIETTELTGTIGDVEVTFTVPDVLPD